jgi:hypothetical protein
LALSIDNHVQPAIVQDVLSTLVFKSAIFSNVNPVIAGLNVLLELVEVQGGSGCLRILNKIVLHIVVDEFAVHYVLLCERDIILQNIGLDGEGQILHVVLSFLSAQTRTLSINFPGSI